MSFKIGQLKIGNDIAVIIIENNQVYKINKGGPQRTLDILRDCVGPNALSEKIRDIKKNFGFSLLTSEIKDLDKLGIIEKPLYPPEVWAVGVTYKRQALEHDKDLEKRKSDSKGIYSYVYSSERAEVFFKGFNRTCVGNLSSLFLRSDSKQTMPEAEMVLVLGEDGLPIGYTLGNDLTAWDIETESPLFLNQAKIWDGSSSIGPFIIPADQIVDPYLCMLRCVVKRDGKEIIKSSGETSQLKRSIEELCYFLKLHNKVPCGTILFTGTCCVIPHNFALEDNDEVIVSMSQIGELRNNILRHKVVDKNYNRR